MENLHGIAWDVFLRRHWQRTPWFGRGALPALANAVTRTELFGLARRDDVESRLVLRNRGRWTVEHGPFTARRLARLPARDWTLLVNGVDLHLPAMRALADCFRAIPWARHDDVMASYAAPGGGVGPHFDSYDVFLVQASGRRRWQLSTQRDLALVPDAPLKILRRMRRGKVCTAAPGDVLYLPPRVAHDGVALDPCITLSVGFRAPGARELKARFLDYLHERLDLSRPAALRPYTDRGLRLAQRPGAVPARQVRQAARDLARIRWRAGDVVEFLGAYLSEPKPHVVFAPPSRPLPPAAFARAAARRGIVLDAKSRLLYAAGSLFMNGEALKVPVRARAPVQRLADRRSLPPQPLPTTTTGLLHAWYRAGYLHLGNAES
jgi:50S ribosomal protein L16 3-hydroxylase